MYSEFLALFAALAATVLANDGDATYNQGDMVAVGACADKHPVVPAGHYSTAISTVIWDDSAHCGKVVNVHGPNGATIPVVVVDRCMGCAANSLDLSMDGFAQLADLSKGRIPVSWEWI